MQSKGKYYIIGNESHTKQSESHIIKFKSTGHLTFSGTSLLRTLWDLNFSPYYRGVLNSEVI